MQHFINGIEVMPVDGENLGISIDFTKDVSEAELSVDAVKLTTEAYANIKQHRDAGQGLFEGVPYQIKIGSLTLDYYVDLTKSPKFADSYVECNIFKRNSVYSFIERAKGLSWESLNAKQTITGAFDVPYIIVPDNQVELLVMLSLTTFTTTYALIQAVQDLVDIIAAGVQATTPNATVPPVPPPGAVIAFALKVAAQAVKVAALIIALIKLLKQVIELVMPPIRNLKGSKMKSLLSQAAAYLGCSFESSALDSLSGLTILPVTLQRLNTSIWDILLGNQVSYYNKHYPSALDTTPMVWDLFEEAKKLLNGRIWKVGNTIRLERRDWQYSQTSLGVINTLNLQDIRQNAHTYNFGDTWKRYYLHYQYDQSDLHTVDKIQGLSTEYSTEPVTIANADLDLITGLVDQSINFALAYRKERLNFVEKEVAKVALFVDKLVNTLGGNSNLYAKVTGRIGVIQISQQHYAVTKLLYTVGGRQPSNYLDYIGADPIYLDWHAINQVKENLKIVAESTLPFAPAQFEAILGNNVMFDQLGNQLEILRFDWTNAAATADIEYQQVSPLGSNTKTVKIA